MAEEREGRYQIRLQWDRIKTELDLGRAKKKIYEALKKEGLYDYTYQSFLNTLRNELPTPGKEKKVTPSQPVIQPVKPVAGRDVNKEEEIAKATSETIKSSIYGDESK